MGFKTTRQFTILASPWMTIGISLVLIAVVLFQAVMNYNREKKIMGQILNEKGAALIRSFEAGAKTGMRGMMGNRANMQALLEETAFQPDIAYIFIVDRTGEILAHNDPGKIGTSMEAPAPGTALTPGKKPQWRIVNRKGNATYFEVYKTFLPLIEDFRNACRSRAMGAKGTRSNWCSPGWMKDLPGERLIDPENRPAIFIGMDVRPFEEAVEEDLRNSGIMMAVILLLGMAGVVSLFWARSYTRSRKLLQDTRAFASETMANLPMGIVVVNRGSGVMYINEAACLLLGTTVSAAGNSSARELMPRGAWQMRRLVSRENRVVEKEIPFQTGKNKSVPVSVSVSDIIGEEGNFIGSVFILKDLSEIRSLEQQVQRKEKLAALGNLASGIAHEVRTPLSSIKGYATFLGSLFDHGSENRKAAHIMAEEVDRVDRVISELLEFARPADLTRKSTDIEQFLDNSLRIIRHEAGEAGVEIIREASLSRREFTIDPDRFSQVLLNLYVNALQAMEEGGTLTVRARSDNQEVVFEISDTGGGIEAEDQARIFNPYYTNKKRGTGLGLAIVHKIVESHGGSIHIESDPGRGTTFSIAMPVTPREAI